MARTIPSAFATVALVPVHLVDAAEEFALDQLPGAVCAAVVDENDLEVRGAAGQNTGEFGVRVNSISPGMFFTRIYSGAVPEEQREALSGSLDFPPTGSVQRRIAEDKD